MSNETLLATKERGTSVVSQLLGSEQCIGLYAPHTQLLDRYLRIEKNSIRTENKKKPVQRTVQRAVLFDLRIFMFDNCISCNLITPIIQFAKEHGYIQQIEIKKYDNKQQYMALIEKIATKHTQPPCYPLVIVQSKFGEKMIPTHVINDILESWRHELDEQTFLDIISGDSTPDSMKTILTPLTSKFILGMYEANQIGSAA